MYYCCKGIQFESKKFNFVCGLGMRLNLIDTTTHLILLSVPYNVVATCAGVRAEVATDCCERAPV